jgi:hypothetical protein
VIKANNRYEFPVGDVTYITPEIPALNQIVGHDLPKKEQRWKRIPFPDDETFEALSPDEQGETLVQNIRRRLYGMWFMNDGLPTYITGDHFMYINHWYIAAETSDGYPEYRHSDLLKFYFWDYCEKDENCVGQMYLTQKRDGKSESALCMIYNKVSIYEGKHGALQSLTGPTAKTNLFDRVIRSWDKMPYYMKPTDEGIYPPKKALRFFAPSKKTSKSKRLVSKKAIDSWIDYLPTVATALQGKKPFRVLLDEPGTVQEMDLIDWFTTTKMQCVTGKKITGKINLPTTIETLSSKGAKGFIELWNKSDYKDKDANGQTKSGLYRYFKPAYLGYEGFVDEYGNDMKTADGEFEAKIYLQNKFDAASPEDRVKLKRQYPFTVEDAFDMVASDVWESDVKSILKDVRTQLINEEPPILYASIYELGSEIKLGESNKNGKDVVKIYEKPKQNVVYKAGYDGSASDMQTGDERGSKTAFVIMKAFEGVSAENYTPVCTFSVRPEKMEEAYRTIFLLSKYYGQYGNFEVLGESNAGQASPVVAYFANRGGLKYIMKKPKTLGFNYNEKSDKFWIYRNEHVKDLQKKLANQFLRRYGHNLKHLDLVEDLLKLGKENTDEADAFLMAILALGDFDKVVDSKPKITRTTRQVRMIKRRPDGSTYVEWENVPISQ